MTTFGVDVSNWQAGMNIEQLVPEGFKFSIFKASQNTNFWDTYFVDFVFRAKSAGLLTGGYHWIHNNNGARQAEIFYNRMREVGGPDGMLAALDVEEVNDAPSWNTLITFRDRWNELTNGHPLIIYTGKWWWPSDWNGPSLSPYLWHSEYVGGNDYASNLYEKVPGSYWNGYGGWSKPTILQFSGTGIASNKTQVDVDAIQGNLSELYPLTGKADDVELTDNVECKDWWNLRNGVTQTKSVALLLGQTNDAAETTLWRTTDVLATVRQLQLSVHTLTELVTTLAQGGTSLDTTAVLQAIAVSRQTFMAELDEDRDRQIAALQSALTALALNPSQPNS